MTKLLEREKGEGVDGKTVMIAIGFSGVMTPKGAVAKSDYQTC